MPEETLGGQEDEGPRLGAEGLASQEMEILGRSGRVGHLHIPFGTQLEKPFRSRRRVLGPLSFVPMGKQKSQASSLAPFCPTRCKELVDDDLGDVHEIPELSFPQDEIRIRPDLVAVLETQDRRQEPQRGGWLMAEFGRGHYTYFAYAIHRQVPYGVAGPYRIFANLLSLGQR